MAGNILSARGRVQRPAGAPVTTRVLEPTPANVALAAETLRRGEPVAFPTETVYGLAAPVFDDRAVARVFAVKERPTFDPLIVHVAEVAKSAPSVLAALEGIDLVETAHLAPEARQGTEALLRSFWPGPFTLVLPKSARVPDLVTGGLPTVGIRMPRHPVAQAFIAAARVPVAAPSANRFGRISPTTAEAVLAELGGRIGIVLDGGPCEVGVESTVVSFDAEGGLTLLRPGGTPVEAIERVLGTRLRRPGGAASESPGMLPTHYAPAMPLYLLPRAATALGAGDTAALRAPLPSGARRAGLLVVSGNAETAGRSLASILGLEVLARSLSETGDLEEAARNLFATLRGLDASDVDLLFAEPCPVYEGLGHAIADRLERAARKPGAR